MDAFIRLMGLGWSYKDMPSQAGKRAVITGGDSGLAVEISRRLLEHDLSELVLASRSMDLLQQTAEDLREEFPGSRIYMHHVDMAEFSSVRKFAEALQSDDKPIHLLFNNAGRFLDTPFEVTKDGFEIQMKTNYYGHVYLTQLLLRRLHCSGYARIINMCSEAEMFGTLDWNDLKGAKLGNSGMAAYGRSKLFLLMYGFESQRRLKLAEFNADAYNVHPGIVATGLFLKADLWKPMALITYIRGLISGVSPVIGAMSACYAATAPGLPGGRYISPTYHMVFQLTNIGYTMETQPYNPVARNPDNWWRLYDATIEILREATGEKVPTLPGVPTL